MKHFPHLHPKKPMNLVYICCAELIAKRLSSYIKRQTYMNPFASRSSLPFLSFQSDCGLQYPALWIALGQEQWAGASEKRWCEDGLAHRGEGGRERKHLGGRKYCCLVLLAEMCSLLCPCRSLAEEAQASVVTSSASDGEERGPSWRKVFEAEGSQDVFETWFRRGCNGAWGTLKTDELIFNAEVLK